jgi:hypothetical protein
LSRIQDRVATQHDYTLVAAQAIGMMYAVSVSFRASCQDLMSQTAIVCDAIADKNAPQPTNWAKVVVDLVGKVIDVVSSPKDIIGLPEPLPASTNVGSPDFRYEKFFYEDHDPADHAPEVERERQRHADEKTKPDGVIAQRLGGDR